MAHWHARRRWLQIAPEQLRKQEAERGRFSQRGQQTQARHSCARARQQTHLRQRSPRHSGPLNDSPAVYLIVSLRPCGYRCLPLCSTGLSHEQVSEYNDQRDLIMAAGTSAAQAMFPFRESPSRNGTRWRVVRSSVRKRCVVSGLIPKHIRDEILNKG